MHFTLIVLATVKKQKCICFVGILVVSLIIHLKSFFMLQNESINSTEYCYSLIYLFHGLSQINKNVQLFLALFIIFPRLIAYNLFT